MVKNISIRQLTRIEEMNELQIVEQMVWQKDPTPTHVTFTASNNGGVILGAFEGEKMIGFLYSFAGFNGKKVHLCSHMLGILPEYRKGGLGAKMKFKQAELAKEIGYSEIRWTFDPLEVINARLNLHKLGATGIDYIDNHYGEINDGLNQGLPTDRIQISWKMDQVNSANRNLPFDPERVLIEIDDANRPVETEAFLKGFSSNNGPWFVAIPENLQTMKQKDNQLAKKWRTKSNTVFKTLFASKYKARDLIRNDFNGVSYYLFTT